MTLDELAQQLATRDTELTTRIEALEARVAELEAAKPKKAA